MFCTHCGRRNREDARFCFACGGALETSTPLDLSKPVVEKNSAESVTPDRPRANSEPSTSRGPVRKRCPSCGLPNRETAERCVCGFSLMSSVGDRPGSMTLTVSGTVKRPRGVTLLAVLQFCGGIVLGVIGLICTAAAFVANTTDIGSLILVAIIFSALDALQI